MLDFCTHTQALVALMSWAVHRHMLLKQAVKSGAVICPYCRAFDLVTCGDTRQRRVRTYRSDYRFSRLHKS